MSTGATLYRRLREYLLTLEQLKENGYPFPHPQRPGGAVIFTADEKKPKDCELTWTKPTSRGGELPRIARCRHGQGQVDLQSTSTAVSHLLTLFLFPPAASCRICCRCGTEYLVSSSGRCVRDEECYYHWGRLRRNRGEA